MKFKHGFVCSFAVLALALSSCGGGGSGGGSGVTLPPPPPPPSTGKADRIRFLEQSSFGPTVAAVADVERMGVVAYLDQQLAQTATLYSGYSYMDPNPQQGCPTPNVPPNCFRDNYTLFQLQRQFVQNALTAPDQLRQRVAWALAQFLVTSGTDIKQPYAMAEYQNLLTSGALGNYRDLLYAITLNPAMGDYLDMANNDGRAAAPNENYAREILQLFSIGLFELGADGSPTAVPTYGQNEIGGFAKVFTGWTFPPRVGAGRWTNPRNYSGQMQAFANHHSSEAKTLLKGVTLPAGQSQDQDLNAAIDNIFNHPNVGPFVGKQLIQQLVTSNPSRAYVGRVAAVFNNNGSGVRGDLKAVVRAILLDAEARGDVKTESTYGKLREPLLFLTGLLRSVGGASDGVFPSRSSQSMGEAIYQAPSVFNSYPPDYPLAGTALLGPPFAIYDATTALTRANLVGQLLNGSIAPERSVVGASGTQLDLSSWQAVAGDANALADRANDLLLHGTMSAAMRSSLVTAISAYPASDTPNRARAALYLALTSAQYNIEQ